MKLYRTTQGNCLEHESGFYEISEAWDSLMTRDDLEAHLLASLGKRRKLATAPLADHKALLPPIGSQEVWGAGVTYQRSRAARMEEAKSAGGGDFYDRVYSAKRPEVFFKATPSRVVGHYQKVAIRQDASWSVPEPEFTLLVSPTGKILGYTIGNDMSSRDIEGENPLYLPQAKVYNRCCALGPGILVSSQAPGPSTKITLEVLRGGQTIASDSTALSNMKRGLAELVEYLYRDNVFPNGCFLLTGTGIVPEDSFTLHQGDEIRITIDGIGTLINFVG
jgi:2-dehydro-3-deoxy-D-arabinonate dehydratase